MYHAYELRVTMTTALDRTILSYIAAKSGKCYLLGQTTYILSRIHHDIYFLGVNWAGLGKTSVFVTEWPPDESNTHQP